AKRAGLRALKNTPPMPVTRSIKLYFPLRTLIRSVFITGAATSWNEREDSVRTTPNTGSERPYPLLHSTKSGPSPQQNLIEMSTLRLAHLSAQAMMVMVGCSLL